MDVVKDKVDKLMSNNISVFDLNNEDIEILKENIKNNIKNKKEELTILNKKIKNLKVKIDNLSN